MDMDEGAFRWLWEAAESRALSDYRKYRKSVPSIPDAGTRALTALRATGKSKKQDAKKGRRRKIK